MESPGKAKNTSGRILAIDYGEKRIGLAISDPLNITAQGMKTIILDRRNTCFTAIADLVREYRVAHIIIGMPYTLSGTEGEAAKRVRAFVRELRRIIDVSIEFVDERLSSVEAKKSLVSMGYKTGHKKEMVDRIAAIFILQTYLDAISQ